MTAPRPTRRGVAVLAVAVVGAVAGWQYGGRTLNAVVVPAVALFVLGFVGVLHTERPRVERRAPVHVVADGAASVGLAAETSRPAAAVLVDALPDGVAGTGRVETTTDGRVRDYAVTASRGVHDLGPATATVYDAFGLWTRRFDGRETSTVTAVPPVRPVARPGVVAGGGSVTGRNEFDRVRDYERGDALRDVNWKASAKRADGLLVTEYAGDRRTARVTVGVGASGDVTGAADAAATAAASVAVALLEAGVTVGLATPSDRLEPASGADHRRSLLAALARFDGGDAPDADVTVTASGADVDAATVVSGSDRWRFGALAAAESGDAADAPDAADGAGGTDESRAMDTTEVGP